MIFLQSAAQVEELLKMFLFFIFMVIILPLIFLIKASIKRKREPEKVKKFILLALVSFLIGLGSCASFIYLN